MVVAKDASNHLSGAETGARQKNPEPANPWEIEQSPPGLIESPIDFLFAEHHRQRQAANALHLVASGEFDAAGIEKLIVFLETDFEIHVADEELSFFPLLQARCLPEDNIEKLIRRLADEHKKDETTVASMTVTLKEVLSGKKLSHEKSRAVYSFAEHILQHLALENAVLLPIARARLDEESQNILSDMLKERRAGSK